MGATKSGSFKTEDSVTCESCRYRVSAGESRFVDCEDCGSYHLCDYCFLDFKSKKQAEEMLDKKEGSSDEELEKRE